jgi:hypothetical protein
MLCGDVHRAPPRAALCKPAIRRAAVPSLSAARSAAPLRRAHAWRASAERQSGGGADEANTPLTLADLTTALSAALSPVHEGLNSLRTDTTSLRTDMTSMRTDITSLRTDITSLRTDTTSLRTDTTATRTDMTSMRTDMTSMRSVAGAMSDNFGALAEVLAGGRAASQWRRARVCSLGELGAAVLGHEEGDDE